jgi:WD40 repeat protein
MSYCLNPNCLSPQNPDDAVFCQRCKSRLLLNDRYRSLDPIGGGSFGRTFKARDEYKPSKPNCVIKQFHGKGFDDAAKAKELFHREAELQEKLGKHPQIPELLALCPQDNYLYLVQEFIDGRNLNQKLKEEGTFSEDKIWQLLEDLLPVLQFVHANQVIHRDVKPENIIRHSTDERLFLVDFGIAKLATEAILAKTGTVIGTEGYTAPEQHEGKPCFASDLYSLGATCYHLLTYADPSRLLYSWVDWQKELRDKLDNKDISHKLIEVLTKLLQPDISQRYQSADEVLQELNSESPPTAELPLVFPTFLPKSGTQSWKCVRTLTGHSNVIQSVAISPDGKTVASGSSDKTIKIWHLDTGRLLHTLTGHSKCVHSLAITPDGQMLASCGDQTVKIWNLNTGQLLRTLKHLKSVSSVAISPDGQTLVSGGNKTIKIWNLHTEEWPRTISEDLGYVCSTVISPDGQTLASGSTDQTIKIWNLNTGQLLHTLSGHRDNVSCLAINPDGQTLVSGSFDKTIQLWDLNTGERIRILFHQSRRVNSVVISPDGQTLAISGYGVINILDLLTGEQVFTLCDLSGWVNSIAISLDGQTLAAGGSDAIIKIGKRD